MTLKEKVYRLLEIHSPDKHASRIWNISICILTGLNAVAVVFSADLRVLRIVRLAQMVRLLEIARYSRAVALLKRVAARTNEALIVGLVTLFGLLLISASMMYYAEKDAQHQAFSSIPKAMWWAVATVTTVGYGDVYPITSIGRVIGCLVAICGIAAFAFPTAILGAGFLAEIAPNSRERQCPSCEVSIVIEGD